MSQNCPGSEAGAVHVAVQVASLVKGGIKADVKAPGPWRPREPQHCPRTWDFWREARLKNLVWTGRRGWENWKTQADGAFEGLAWDPISTSQEVPTP